MIDGPLGDLQRTGAGVLRGAFSSDECAAVLREVCRGLRPAPRLVGSVTQEASMAIRPVDDTTGQATRRLCNGVVKELSSWPEPISGFVPNELTVMAYRKAGVGISAHRDESRFRRALASVTLRGAGVLTLVADDDVAVASWPIERGDLVVMVGGNGLGLPRPRHLLITSQAPRVSITLRMLEDQ